MKIEFNTQQMQVLNAALIKMPYEISAPVINHINAEIQKAFDAKANDGPTGQTNPEDEFRGD